MAGLILLGAALLVGFWAIALYNRLVRTRIDCDNGFSQIDVQLRRRYDLIPNLVETVKGYAGHERQTLEAVVAARSRAQSVTGDAAHAADRSQAEGALTQALGRVFALAEAYPDLKANANFRELQEELTSTENKIGFARQHYNDCVARYEGSRQAFPGNLISNSFGFQPREYFRIEESAAREVPKVSFS